MSTPSPESPHFTPLAINLAGLPCLVVGGGRVGTRKARILASGGAEVTVLAPKISADLQDLVRLGRVRWRQQEYRGPVENEFFLVVAATSDAALNDRIGREARAALVCVVSSVEASRVIFPAVYADGSVTVAVHSDGRDCRRSQRVRDRIAATNKDEG
jgi:precorrin-2 dehydrogenase/sirohydrochlorin ferrochelatase